MDISRSYALLISIDISYPFGFLRYEFPAFFLVAFQADGNPPA